MDCPNKASGGVKQNHGTQQKPPERCPACGSHHTATDADGRLWYKNHLSVCEVFRAKSPEERAGLVQLTEGCALCLDWTGDHKARDCKAKSRSGKLYEACSQMEGGCLAEEDTISFFTELQTSIVTWRGRSPIITEACLTY